MKGNLDSGILWLTAAVLVLAMAVPGFASEGSGENRQIQWIEGPAQVDLGDKLAQVNMGEEYLFAGPDDTRTVMAYLGNPPTNAEVGMIIPKGEDQGWFVVFEFFQVGYVRDDDKDEIDAAAILESYRRGTEETNEEREKMGHSPLHVVGWYEEPHYDENTHNLTWAMLLESGEDQVVNYNVRILGRSGYMSAVLVSDPESLAALLPKVGGLIANFSYNQGSRYAEFVQGDKLAKYGLTALIAGGAGAAAVKMGLLQALAKAWKVVFVAMAAFFAAIWRFVKGIFVSEDRTSMRVPDSEPRTG